MLTHLSLFTGIGGIDLAAEWAGFETVGQVEWADYPTKILEKHWPDVPRWRDIRTLNKEDFSGRTGLETIDLLSGGFPCQPFSVAGKQKGKEDERYLWPEMLRVIRELKPTWVIGENVPGILRSAGKTVCEDLEREGYFVTVFDFEAAAVGARHRRERVFFVGHTIGRRQYRQSRRRSGAESEDRHIELEEESEFMADAGSERLEEYHATSDPRDKRYGAGRDDPQGSARPTEPRLGRGLDGISSRLDGIRRSWLDGTWEVGIPRVATGVKNRADRIKALGNAVVPQQVYPILKAIADYEKARKDV